MSDIIHLLPDAVANQIAAGEVVQRPASAVKELLENSIDAGATSIKLIIKDAGKALLQVIDNGCGMSETDARMSFERHATSKIRKADDLFNIRTMGFRGEALASIAAIAQVELRARRTGDTIGTQIIIDGSEVKSQEPFQCAEGTSFSVRNLFYNVPARRNFLKSNAVETRHIIDEFERVALVHPEIEFSFFNNDNEVFHLQKGSFRQRIVGIFGNNYNQRLVPVEEETDIVKVIGFIGKPEFSKKVRGEQFFFVNKRFIKNAYLHHAIQAAFRDFLQADSFPSYFLMLDINPANIDVNIHPTKTEIKFDDEKSIYAIVLASVKKSLGQYHIAPSLDFQREPQFDLPYSYKNKEAKEPTIAVNPEFNPFATPLTPPKKGGEFERGKSENPFQKSNRENWEKLYSRHANNQLEMPVKTSDTEVSQQLINSDWSATISGNNQKLNYQLHQKYILTNIKSGLAIIDQQRAHERILYERFLSSLQKQKGISQQQLFPKTVTLSAADFELLKELKNEVTALGFDINEFGKNTFVINGIPTEAKESEAQELLESVIENYKKNQSELKLNKTENLARSMAKKLSMKSEKVLSNEEMNNLVDELFGCQSPYSSPAGKPTVIAITMEELDKKFMK